MKFLLQPLYFLFVLLPLTAHAGALTPLTVTHESTAHTFKVAVADTPARLEQGLMYRESMPADEGMLFLFTPPREVSMWMKNTKIPLDMLFIGEDRRIRHIAENTVPMSLEAISSGGPVAAILELNGGTAKRLGIKAGDAISHAKLP